MSRRTTRLGLNRACVGIGAVWAVAVLSAMLARATPGTAYVVLQPGSGAGTFDVEDWLAAAQAWPAASIDHPDGWSVVYDAAAPPPGWSRPFIWRGGGRAAEAGRLHPRYACALEEMLPARRGAMVVLHDAPDSAASFPGKPNPYPMVRDGWRFVHDGRIDIESVTLGLWQGNLGPDWPAFKTAHPRDYNGNGDPTRGCAGEIVFLALLHEIEQEPSDVPRAFRRTLARLAALPGWDDWQCNAILQNEEETYALRYVPGDAERYPIHLGVTLQGEVCITDSLPPAGGAWTAVPNRMLVVLPASGEAQWIPMEFSGAGPRAGAAGSGLRLAPVACPWRASIRLEIDLPPDREGVLELFDLQGRCLIARRLPAGQTALRWEREAGTLPAGVLLARLSAGDQVCWTRGLLVR